MLSPKRNLLRSPRCQTLTENWFVVSMAESRHVVVKLLRGGIDAGAHFGIAFG